ncbi:MAG: CoA transferase, partial [Betaproteobacteria bacterium]|nr:CoA transferase [Betaproteobacteria bacterium]
MGPLAGIKMVEIAGLGPAPMCAMLFADLGATVIRIERKAPIDLGLTRPRKYDLLLRSRPAIAVDLKTRAGVELVLDLVKR